jgi:pimeloyl-ACP methyl ester carboxylesterase
MKIEIVKLQTDDDVTLHGAWLDGTGRNQVPGVDAVLMMHGNGGNFYGDFFVEFAEHFARLGCPTMRANNRGHDIVSRASATDAARFGGVAYEMPEECIVDFRAWIGWLAAHGHRRVLLWGHSRGAVKTLYYQARENDPRLMGCIAASPPWLSYSRFVRSTRAEQFLADRRRAERMVAEGDPEGVFRCAVPMPYLTGAACYLAKYGPDETLNVFRFIDRITGPVLAFSGTEEVASRFAFDDLDRELDAWAKRMPNLSHVSIPGADHFYVGKKDVAFGAVMQWLERLDTGGRR